MKTTSSLVKLVIFIAVTVLATGTLAATIGNFRFGGTESYKALFTDVTGLQKGDDVRIAGVRVGQVDGVAVARHGAHNLGEVTFSVDKSRPLAVSTHALIRYRNLIGQRYIALSEGAGSSKRLRSGGTLPVKQTQPALDLTVLFDGFKPLFAALNPKDINAFAFEIVQTLQGEAGNINSLLSHTASLTTTLADRDKVIGRTIDNLNTVLATVDRRDDRLSQLLVQLQRFVGGLSQDREAIGASLTNISGLADTTSDLLRDARPAVRDDVRKLATVTGTLDNNRELVDTFLKRLPNKLNTITRTATYGSWFNFYLCDFEGKVTLSNVVAFSPDYHASAARCG
jgi:phospholipid/cholesterol/gamma-HCH transport system substrate-binding protein